MDIDLLAKMVKEAILDNDAVTLPGVGCFVAELVPSSFSDKGYTIHPPYRRLYFSPKQGSDTLLADMYASARNVDREDATRVLAEFLAGMKEVLKVRKTIVFPGLGRLRATRENHFFFVADEDLDIYPEGFGLVPVSLKTHEETPEEVATAVAGLAEVMTAEPVTDIEEVEPEPVEEQAPAEASAFVEEPVPVEDPAPVEEPIVTEPAVDKPAVEEPVAVIVPEPVPEPEPIPEPAPEPMPEPAPEPEEEIPVVEDTAPVEKEPVGTIPLSDAFKETQRLEYLDRQRRKKLFKVLRIVLIVLGALLALLLLYVLISRIAPDWLDSLLYSKEELEILRY